MYKCSLCKRQFRAGRAVSAWTLWEEYLTGKQTVPALARRYGTSESTVKRRLATIAEEWEQPEISGGGFVHLDATYWVATGESLQEWGMRRDRCCTWRSSPTRRSPTTETP